MSTEVHYSTYMSNSGSGFYPDAELRVAIPYPLVIAAVISLAAGDNKQRELSGELGGCLPAVILAKVQDAQDDEEAGE